MHLPQKRGGHTEDSEDGGALISCCHQHVKFMLHRLGILNVRINSIFATRSSFREYTERPRCSSLSYLRDSSQGAT